MCSDELESFINAVESLSPMIKVISFDMDNTLIDSTFDDKIWFEEIPRLYSEKNSLSLKDAKEKVFAQYDPDCQGYLRNDLGYWFERLGLGDWKPSIERNKNLIGAYPETTEVLAKLSQTHKLIVVTQSPAKFYEVKLAETQINQYISKVFSTITDFKKRHKEPEMYKAILLELGIKSDEMVHIGDSERNDNEYPASLRIKCFLLDRTRTKKGTNIVYDLNEFYDKILELEKS